MTTATFDPIMRMLLLTFGGPHGDKLLAREAGVCVRTAQRYRDGEMEMGSRKLTRIVRRNRVARQQLMQALRVMDEAETDGAAAPAAPGALDAPPAALGCARRRLGRAGRGQPAAAVTR